MRSDVYRSILGNKENTNNLIGPQTTFYRWKQQMDVK